MAAATAASAAAMEAALGAPPDTFDFGTAAPLHNVPPAPSAEFAAFLTAEAAEFLDLVAREQLEKVEDHWHSTWGAMPADLVAQASTAGAIGQARVTDRGAYATAMEQLMPDVFQRLSPQYVKLVRNFAKRLEQWMADATKELPAEFAAHKVREVAMFGQRLRRYTGLNHLASAARAVLTKPNHIQSMKDDYSRVDFDAVRDQAVWLSEDCDPAVIDSLEEEFRKFHGTSNLLESWASWLQTVVRRVVGPFEGRPELASQAGAFQLRWCLISSLVIRDLTLRSADSFGMFHLMRLLCDEYIFFLLEKAVMSGCCPSITHRPDGGDERKSLEEVDAKRSGSSLNVSSAGMDTKRTKAT